MSSATAVFLNPLSIAESCLPSVVALFAPKSQYPILSLPSKPTKWVSLNLNLNLKHKSFLPLQVAQTSDWTQEEEQVEAEEEAAEDTTVGVEAEDDSADGVVAVGEEEYYPEPPEEAKLYVGNLPYDVDSEKLANIFNEAGIVEIARSKIVDIGEYRRYSPILFDIDDFGGRNMFTPSGSAGGRIPAIFSSVYRCKQMSIPRRLAQ